MQFVVNMSPHYAQGCLCCCLLVNHVVYKHGSMFVVWKPTHPQNVMSVYGFLELNLKEEEENNMKNHSPIMAGMGPVPIY